MVNEKTVEECGIKEGDFLVLMISSTISATKPKEIVKVTESKPETKDAVSGSSTSTATTTPPTISATTTANIMSVNEEAVNSICEMGFPREEVIRALKASFNNSDRAVEYLTNGIPDEADIAEADGEEGDLSGFKGLEPSNATVVDAASMEDNPLVFLLQSPQFIQLRLVVQQNPRLLGPLLEQIAQSNPEVFELIKDNQDAFMSLIQTPLTDTELQLLAADAGDGSDDGEGGEEGDFQGGEQDDVDPTTVIQVNEDERAAIERLMALGFDRPRVIEAYFACDKNETIAANFLFEHMNDEDF